MSRSVLPYIAIILALIVTACGGLAGEPDVTATPPLTPSVVDAGVIMLPDSTPNADTAPSTLIDRSLLGKVLIAVGAILLFIAAVLFWTNRRSSPGEDNSEVRIEVLLKQIADLDDCYQADTMDAALYQKQRKRLKAELANLMEQSV